MSSEKRDTVDCLLDIVENADRIARYIAAMDKAALASDSLTRDAVERCIERVCEAVFRLGERAERLLPGHDIRDIRGMGNQLRHAYHQIDVDIVWGVASLRLPALALDAQALADRLQTQG